MSKVVLTGVEDSGKHPALPVTHRLPLFGVASQDFDAARPWGGGGTIREIVVPVSHQDPMDFVRGIQLGA